VTYPPAGAPIAPSLLLSLGAEQLELQPGQVLTIGRGGGLGRQVTDTRVSRRHLEVSVVEGRWTIADVSSAGTYVDGQRIQGWAVDSSPIRLRLGAPDGIELSVQPIAAAHHPEPGYAYPAPPAPSGYAPAGGYQPPVASTPIAPVGGPGGPVGPVGPVPSQLSGQPALSALHRIDLGTLTIGRSPDNDVVVDDLLASRHHARLSQTPAGWMLVDLNSHNGTFVNGARIHQQIIGPEDIVAIGHLRFHLSGGRLEEYTDTGDITFEARELSVVIDGKTLLDRVGFFLAPRSLLAVIGPSGSGKSTLLKALTGLRPADYGGVGYGGRDLYANYDELRSRIGLVPQDDILHTQLQVRTALSYSARLRFPQDVSVGEREHRIDTVLADLGLSNQASQRIDTLSGGQRKRTSTALELLTQPSLLFLDEPTSGLDSGWDKSVMTKLRELADGGRTVVVVSHSVAHLDVCDRLLVLAPGGRMAYFGPPDQALAYFGAADYADMYTMLERDAAFDWAGRFRASPQYNQYVVQPASAGQSHSPMAPPGAASAQQTFGSQLSTLCQRYLAVIGADRQFIILMAAMPLVLAIFSHVVPAPNGLSLFSAEGRPSSKAFQLLLVLIIGGCLIGSTAAVREIVKERPIYERERAIGLHPMAYLASKVVVLAGLTAVQAFILAVLGLIGRKGPDSGSALGSGSFEIIVLVIATTLCSMTIGLLLSALVKNADRTMPLLVVIIMAQLLLSGGLFAIAGRPLLQFFSWFAPARWGFAAGASTLNGNLIPDAAAATGRDSDFPHDSLWTHSGGAWIGDIFALMVLAAIYLGITAALVDRIGRPSRRR
jgi:ABC-type multidrug transport system ATPase subunit